MKTILKPRALQPGSRIAVVATGGPPDPRRLEEGIAILENMGFSVVVADTVSQRRGYLAGSDKQRASDLQNFLTDESIDAVFCARGGYGSLRLLDYLDFNRLGSRIPLLMGYSDVTCLQLALYNAGGWVTIQGPMVAIDLVSKTREAEPENPLWYDVVSGFGLTGREFQGQSLIAGQTTGPLVGGCLTLIQSLCGSPFMPDMTDHVLFFEDIHEEPYRLDRILTAARLSGAFDKIAGVCVGSLQDCEPRGSEPSLTMAEILRDCFGDLGIPVVTDLPFGHGPEDILVIPIGVQVTLDAESGTLTFCEEAVE